MRRTGHPSLEFRIKLWGDNIKRLQTHHSHRNPNCDFVKKNKLINSKLRQIKEVEPAYKNII